MVQEAVHQSNAQSWRLYADPVERPGKQLPGQSLLHALAHHRSRSSSPTPGSKFQVKSLVAAVAKLDIYSNGNTARANATFILQTPRKYSHAEPEHALRPDVTDFAEPAPQEVHGLYADVQKINAAHFRSVPPACSTAKPQ